MLERCENGAAETDRVRLCDAARLALLRSRSSIKLSILQIARYIAERDPKQVQVQVNKLDDCFSNYVSAEYQYLALCDGKDVGIEAEFTFVFSSYKDALRKASDFAGKLVPTIPVSPCSDTTGPSPVVEFAPCDLLHDGLNREVNNIYSDPAVPAKMGSASHGCPDIPPSNDSPHSNCKIQIIPNHPIIETTIQCTSTVTV